MSLNVLFDSPLSPYIKHFDSMDYYNWSLDRENAISKRHFPISTKIRTDLIYVLLNHFLKF